MTGTWQRLRILVDSQLPEGSPRRKVVQLVSLVLLFEGMFVVALFSYFGITLGVVSIILGLVIMLLLYRAAPSSAGSDAPLGLRLLPRMCSLLGGEVVVMSLGVLVIVLVVVFNAYSSSRPDLGDVDTITIMLGAMLFIYPLMSRRAVVESSFALLFIGFVFLFLAAPQGLAAITGGNSSSGVGSWYVHYMLAAPFSGSLSLLGIQSTSVGDVVTIQLQDGTIHSLMISTYCAGLYSFSIFLSAFISFILVFERLTPRRLVVVLTLGLAAAYLGNLLRMILIGVIGYYEGIEALLWAHRNVGWIVFLVWSIVFWWLIVKYAVNLESKSGVDHDEYNRGGWP